MLFFSIKNRILLAIRYGDEKRTAGFYAETRISHLDPILGPRCTRLRRDALVSANAVSLRVRFGQRTNECMNEQTNDSIGRSGVAPKSPSPSSFVALDRRRRDASSNWKRRPGVAEVRGWRRTREECRGPAESEGLRIKRTHLSLLSSLALPSLFVK